MGRKGAVIKLKFLNTDSIQQLYLYLRLVKQFQFCKLISNGDTGNFPQYISTPGGYAFIHALDSMEFRGQIVFDLCKIDINSTEEGGSKRNSGNHMPNRCA